MAYTQEEIDKKFDEICTLVAKGDSLRTVLFRKDMPSTTTFYKWVDSSEDKTQQYTRACEDRTDKMADEILKIADSDNLDVKIDKDGNIQVNGANIQRSRLQVDARKWLMAKLQPKKYGDKTYIDHTTKGKPITGITFDE